MEPAKKLKDKLIEFLTISATLSTLIFLLGIDLKGTIILTSLGVGLGYITTLHIKNFFQRMNDNIEEIKRYIREKDTSEKGIAKMDKKGKVSWLVIAWSVIIGLLIVLLVKTIFKL